ncbi:hypothetical protein [Blastochloris viridis]|uniref:Uncharacterized protein n=1 Tax=Blastochloris viridis TaxID=1079 RepID=A0A0H5BE75_BLAVI|nr:hypothetical protein [Blastochloris viridis]ALK08084.1 hypothetical protein BVIR_269 [Blastochloris viridis]BAR98656.1 hypothetical protein BV133_1063 [Blastochloris viridis]CUU44006.1 hypothetical protein BVIRIDIS_30350 [Blastochloris viridis]
MARRRQAPDLLDEEPLLREAKRLMLEADRIAQAPDGPAHRVRLLALISDVEEVRRAMAERRDALGLKTDTVVRQMTAVSAYNRIAQTLVNGRKRP